MESNTAEVAVAVKTDDTLDLSKAEDKKTVVNAITDVVKDVVKTADKGSSVEVEASNVEIPDIPYPVKDLDETKINELVKKYVPDTYAEGDTATVTVVVSGVKITYTITLE